MSKTFQCMKLCVYGRRFLVIQHFEDTNPFWLYEVTTGIDKYGYRSQHKNLIVKYCNFESVLYHLLETKVKEFKIDYRYRGDYY